MTERHNSSLNQRVRRTCSGGVLPLIMLVATIIAALILVAIGTSLLMLSNAKLNSTTENIGLQAAVQLNKGDRIGEMNAMIERSREAVFTSRRAYDDIAKQAPHVEPLARLLLDDARVGATRVEEERQLLSGMLGKELEISITSKVKETNDRGPMNLMLLTLTPTENTIVEVGSLRDMPSNATAPVALEQLKEFDRSAGYFYQKTDFYRPEISVKLPAPDNDLNFVFASLHPRIKDTIASARLITPDDFDGRTVIVAPGRLIRPRLHNLPTAIRVVTKTNVSAPLNLREDMAITTIVSATGSEKSDNDSD
ncbi:hypothetical protein KF728_19375 [Candidatus Obscuribacterales bacterium]|nr:hypothetical protein [Candidatus Obscuribacterales bacterium]